MQLSQTALFKLACASLIAGFLLAFFCDALYMTRLWLMPSNIRYTVPTIQKLRISQSKKGKQKKKGRGMGIAIFFSDVLVCLVGAVTLILLLFWLNNGAFRAAAPLGMAVGFCLWHRFISKGVRVALQWLAFGIETLLYTLIMPFERFFTLIAKACKANAQKRRVAHLARARQAYTKQALQNIEATAEQLLPIHSKSRKRKGDSRAEKRKEAV